MVIPITVLNVDPAGNVSPKHYTQYADQGELLVHSMFRTIQGEGPYAGRVAQFIRLGGCNLGAKEACAWCDTAFSVGDSRAMNVDMILDAITDSYGPIDPNHLTVITGGEPLLQHRMLMPLIEAIEHEGGTVQIETNGLYLNRDSRLAKYCIISPKIAAGTNRYHAVGIEQSDAILGYKFVVTSDETSAYHKVPDWAFEAGEQFAKVYISPMAVYKRTPVPGEVSNAWDDTMIDREATARNYAYAAQYVMDMCAKGNDCQLSIQSHLFLTVP